jgi:hypothetical protein
MFNKPASVSLSMIKLKQNSPSIFISFFGRENFGGKILAGKFWRENFGGEMLAGNFWRAFPHCVF